MLTELQKIALPQLWKSSAGNGHDFGFTDCLKGFTRAQHGGIISGLVQAGYIYVELSDVNGEPIVFLYFTESGKNLFKNFQESSELK